jgi:hypothetical protein
MTRVESKEYAVLLSANFIIYPSSKSSLGMNLITAEFDPEARVRKPGSAGDSLASRNAHRIPLGHGKLRLEYI